MVRFARSGGEANAIAIRIARASSKKNKIALCGYHGWQDWYICSTSRDLGVPDNTKDLTHKFSLNNISSLEKIFEMHDLACVIIEPMNLEYPKDNFLKKVKELTQKNNALLIFDETITGFRFSLGGAQKLFNVVPDMATFGKGLGNGYPLSALVGRDQVMSKVEDIFFSGTFGGETLSLAAAGATIDKYKSKNVVDKFYEIGTYLLEKLDGL